MQGPPPPCVVCVILTKTQVRLPPGWKAGLCQPAEKKEMIPTKLYDERDDDERGQAREIKLHAIIQL